MSKPIQSELARLDALITRCEALAEQSPGIYRLRVGLLAHLGIVVVLAVVAGSVLLSVLLIFAIAGLSVTIGDDGPSSASAPTAPLRIARTIKRGFTSMSQGLYDRTQRKCING